MQDINLLKNQVKDTTLIWHKRNRMLSGVFILILVTESLLAAMFFFLSNNIQANKQIIIEENRQTQSIINENQDDLLPAREFQAKLQHLKILVDDHVYWSKFFDELSFYTFKQARFTGVQTNNEGTIFIQGETSNYSDLGRMLLGLSTSGKFIDVRLISSSPSKAQTFSILFTVSLKIDDKLLKRE